MMRRIARSNPQTDHTRPIDGHPAFSRRSLTFASQGEACEAWLYLPKSTGTRPPVVVMAHGMGAQKDMGLDVYAEAFARGGLAAFVFDYRTFGGSDGEPRHWVSPSRHLQDWSAALAYVRGELAGEVDVGRLCLWGTSFAGGHVLATAEATPGITAIISQVPHLDARAAALRSIDRRGVPMALFCLLLGMLDQLATSLGLTALGLPPLYVPLVGGLGSLAFMQLDDFETKEYFSKHPPVYQGGWVNLARACLTWELFFHKYSPIKSVPALECPVLFVAATEDVLCPVEQVYKAAELAKRGELLIRNCTHFELYRGELFTGLVAEQVEFLKKHTSLAPAAKRDAARGARAGVDALLQRDQDTKKGA